MAPRHHLFRGPEIYDPWGAQLFDVSHPATRPPFTTQLDADYRKALEYYDLTTGAQDHA